MDSGYTDVIIQPKFFNNKGKIIMLPARAVTITDILTDGLSNQLRDEHGGGTYLIEVKDPNAPSQQLCTRFQINIMGQPKIPLMPGNIMPATGMPAGGTPTQLEASAGYRFNAPNSGVGGPVGAVRPYEVASYTSDAIALQQVNELREQLKQERRDHAAQQQKLQQKMDLIHAQLEQQRADNVKQQAEAREALFRSELNAIRETITRPTTVQKPTFDVSALIASLGALVPIVTAMITSSKDRQQLTLDAQKHSSEQQFQMLMSLLKKPEDNAGIKLITELLPKLLDANDPGKRADALTAMAESQMSTIHMAAQIAQSMAPEDHPLMAFVREVIGGVTNVVEAAQAAKPQPNSPQLQQQQAQPAQVVSSAPTDAVHSGRQTRPSASARQQRPATPKELANAIVADPRWPADMRGTKWVRLLTALHGEQKTDELGGEIGMMLQGMQQIGELPAALAPMFNDDGPAPSTLLRPFFDLLPIGQPPHQARYEAILRAIDASYDVETPEPGELAHAGNGADEDEDEDDDELHADDAPALVTPPAEDAN